MYGQLQKAVAPDTLTKNVPAFRRVGFGFKGGYRDEGDYAEISVFHSRDNASSLSIPPNVSLLPEENLVMGISLGKEILDRVVFNAEIATSALTRDTFAEKKENANVWEKVFNTRESTSFYNAYKGGVHYKGKNFATGVGYERIDPNYRTHGAYYFNNDLENFTVDLSGVTADGKLSVSTNAGVQHDNLDESKISAMKRIVGSVNVSYRPVNKLSLAGSYSNFLSYTNIRSQFVNINQLTPYDNLDTLKFTQLTQSINLNVSCTIRANATSNQILAGSLSVQDAAEHQGQVSANSGSRFYNMNTFYSVLFIPANFSMVISCNASRNYSQLNDLFTMGPSLSVSKALLQKKLRLGLSSAYNSTFTSGEAVAAIVNVRMNGSYLIGRKHNLNLGLVMVHRDSENMTSFEEYTGTLSYSYSF